MRKATLTLLATLALTVMFALSTAVAMAGLGWDDCPPASSKADPAPAAQDNWQRVEPPANFHAWSDNNPGNK